MMGNQGDKEESTTEESTGALNPTLKNILDAQNGTYKRCVPYAAALKEIQNGRKGSHWIWYVFPAWSVIRKTSRPQFSLPTLELGRAYLQHPLLRARLVEVSQAATKHLGEGDPQKLLVLFGKTDSEKFAETMTFFTVAALVNRDKHAFGKFAAAIDAATAGKLDERTMQGLVTEGKCTMLEGTSSTIELRNWMELNLF
jgi:uncharacterized protein (DUF1810 family)